MQELVCCVSFEGNHYQHKKNGLLFSNSMLESAFEFLLDETKSIHVSDYIKKGDYLRIHKKENGYNVIYFDGKKFSYLKKFCVVLDFFVKIAQSDLILNYIPTWLSNPYKGTSFTHYDKEAKEVVDFLFNEAIKKHSVESFKSATINLPYSFCDSLFIMSESNPRLAFELILFHSQKSLSARINEMKERVGAYLYHRGYLSNLEVEREHPLNHLVSKSPSSIYIESINVFFLQLVQSAISRCRNFKDTYKYLEQVIELAYRQECKLEFSSTDIDISDIKKNGASITLGLNLVTTDARQLVGQFNLKLYLYSTRMSNIREVIANSPIEDFYFYLQDCLDEKEYTYSVLFNHEYIELRDLTFSYIK